MRQTIPARDAKVGSFLIIDGRSLRIKSKRAMDGSNNEPMKLIRGDYAPVHKTAVVIALTLEDDSEQFLHPQVMVEIIG